MTAYYGTCRHNGISRNKHPVLLLIDEVQELGNAKDGQAVVSALRSAITKSKASVRVIFTGSNQDRLRELVTGEKRDDLQEAMTLLRKAPVDAPLQFNNFRGWGFGDAVPPS